jgi:hypothetical protein
MYQQWIESEGGEEDVEEFKEFVSEDTVWNAPEYVREEVGWW